MLKDLISVITIPQLKDNYSYLVVKNNKAIVVDPAESLSIIDYIKSKGLKIEVVLITHHHADHTAGIKSILNYCSVPVYSPDKKIFGTTKVLENEELINLSFINFKIIKTPGHTIDHIVYYNDYNNILFSGDLLFRLGCGKVFEGTYEQMYFSLQKINSLNNKTMVYCGHEYTVSNLSFLMSIFPDNDFLFTEKDNINSQLLKTKSSIPFNLGREKAINPFLSSKLGYYKEFKNKNKFSDIEMFSYLRDLKNNF
jgi:hydroxyacylglutathione hydrolase